MAAGGVRAKQSPGGTVSSSLIVGYAFVHYAFNEHTQKPHQRSRSKPNQIEPPATTDPISTQLTHISQRPSQPVGRCGGRAEQRVSGFGWRRPEVSQLANDDDPDPYQTQPTRHRPPPNQIDRIFGSNPPSFLSNRSRHQCCCWRRRPLDAGHAALRAAWRAAPALYRAERASVEASSIVQTTSCSIDSYY